MKKLTGVYLDVRIPSVMLEYSDGTTDEKTFISLAVAKSYCWTMQKQLPKVAWNKIIHVEYQGQIAGRTLSLPVDFIVEVTYHNNRTKKLSFLTRQDALKYVAQKEKIINGR